MNRRSFIKLAGLGTIGLAWGESMVRAAERSGKPNIIYIMADDLGYAHLGCFGQKDIKTPNIDKMAAEGMRFTNHYAGSALCAPSRCVLMTGLHTGHCFIRNNKPLPVEGNVPIPADSQTIPKVLKKAGYTTACIGKWGLGYPGSEGDPVNQGFDLFFGYNCQRQAHSYYPPHLWRNDKKVILKGNANGKEEDYSHDLLTEEALAFIRESHRKPFFLYLPYTIPHAKFQIPDLGIYADKPWTQTQKAIAAMISRMDRDIGKIAALLKELGVDRNTLVIFTSDNGSAGGDLLGKFNGSGILRGSKGTLYEGGIRAAMVARWPGKVPVNTVTNHICTSQDMMATFAEIAATTIEKHTDGISILPTLCGRKDQKQHEYLYWELKNNVAIRLGDYKAIKSKAAIELFNLREDPSEKNNIAADQPEIVQNAARIMADAHHESGFFNWKYQGPGAGEPEAKTKKNRKSPRR